MKGSFRLLSAMVALIVTLTVTTACGSSAPSSSSSALPTMVPATPVSTVVPTVAPTKVPQQTGGSGPVVSQPPPAPSPTPPILISQESVTWAVVLGGTATVKLTPPGNVPKDQLPQAISRVWEVIKLQYGDDAESLQAFNLLQQSINRTHNKLIQTLINGRPAAQGSAALRAIYAILYKIATKAGSMKGPGMFGLFLLPGQKCILLQMNGVFDDPECMVLE